MKKDTITRTFSELVDIDQLVGKLYNQDPNLQKGKFGYAYKKFADKNYNPIWKQYQDDLYFARLDHALESADGQVIIDPDPTSRGFKYSIAGLKKCVEKERELFKKYANKEIEIIPYLCSNVNTDNFDDITKEALTGLVIGV